MPSKPLGYSFVNELNEESFFLAQLRVVRHAPPNTQATHVFSLPAFACPPPPPPYPPPFFPASSLHGSWKVSWVRGGRRGGLMVPPPPHSPPTLACISSMTTRPGGVSSPFCGIHLRPHTLPRPAPSAPGARGSNTPRPPPLHVPSSSCLSPFQAHPHGSGGHCCLPAPPPPPRAKDTDAHIHRPPTHPPPRHPPTNPTPSTHSPSLGDRRLRAAGTWARLLGLLLPLSSSSAVFVQAPEKRV